MKQGAEYVTLFASSSENWRRTAAEVSFLQCLFIKVFECEANSLNEHGIRCKVIGDIDRFGPELVDAVRQVDALTCKNQHLTLSIALNYGGRWDILQSVQRMFAAL